MNGEHKLTGDPASIWKALNDPSVLKKTIPGAESVEQEGDNRLKAVVRARVGPISARFTGLVSREDENYPQSFTLTGEGKGGVAGFAKGSARIRLDPEEGGTKLSYEVEAAVGGKLAQIGQRLIDSTASKLAGQFFDNFSRLMEGDDIPAPAEGLAPWKYAAIIGGVIVALVVVSLLVW